MKNTVLLKSSVLCVIQQHHFMRQKGNLRNLDIIYFRVSDPHFFFFADPDPDADPGKNFHADPDPDPGGIRGRGVGVKGKNYFFVSFFHVSDDS